MHTIGPRGSLQRPLLCGWGFLLLPPQLPQVFSLRGLRLYFVALEPWVKRSGSATGCSAWPALRHSGSSPLGLSVRECGAAGSASGRTACPVGPTLRQSRSHHGNPSPLRPAAPVSAPPTGLDECLFFISLVSDFLAVRFSVSSGCARRRSVSTYATILVLPQ